eukprot:jgi/Bigna1/137769/aug1.41_g12477
MNNAPLIRGRTVQKRPRFHDGFTDIRRLLFDWRIMDSVWTGRRDLPPVTISFDYSRFDRICDEDSSDREMTMKERNMLPTEDEAKRLKYGSVNGFLNAGWTDIVHRVNEMVPMVRQNGCSRELRKELRIISKRVADLQSQNETYMDKDMQASEGDRRGADILSLAHRVIVLDRRLRQEFAEREEEMKKKANEEIDDAEDNRRMPNLKPLCP